MQNSFPQPVLWIELKIQEMGGFFSLQLIKTRKKTLKNHELTFLRTKTLRFKKFVSGR